jgi:biotin carboxylase
MSHSNPQFVARPLADEFFKESKLPDEQYSKWAVERALQLGIDVIWPSRGARALGVHHDEFAVVGIKLMVCASPETLDVVNDKAFFYKCLENQGLGIPRHRVVKTLEEFKEAARELASNGAKVCLKPCRSLFGLGFKIIGKADPLSAFLYGDSVHVTIEEAIYRLDVPPDRFPRLLVMELLEGPEYSVDCLARDGRLIRATIRRKSRSIGGPEAIIEDTEILDWSIRLSRIFNLSHIFNIQLIRSQDGLRLLEINPRMAGGLYYSCLAGVNYPYWALRLALEPDGADDLPIPDQRSDILVNQHNEPFVYAPRA